MRAAEIGRPVSTGEAHAIRIVTTNTAQVPATAQTEWLERDSIVYVRIISQPPPQFSHWNTLAFTFLAEQGTENVTVFRDRILAIPQAPNSEGVLLGAVIAHELGHVLMRSGHATHGLMKCPWSKIDLDRAALGLLTFEPADCVRMRAEAYRRINTSTPASDQRIPDLHLQLPSQR